MVVSPLGADRATSVASSDKDKLLLKHQHFRYEDNNVAFTHVLPYFYRVRQVEPCH